MTGAFFIAMANGPRVSRFKRHFKPMTLSSMMDGIANMKEALEEAQREREELLRRMN